MRKAFELLGQQVPAGSRRVVELPMPKLNSHSQLGMPVHVIHGRQPGPALFVSAAIHGDELNGIEIIRRVLASKTVSRLRGTLIAVPVVNVYGLIQESRYLPDRRDLNRSFPGSDHGSLAARLADLFMQEIVQRSSHGIDLHTGSLHRNNLPQIRANLDNPETLRLAHCFGVPVLLNSLLRDGSLRQAACERGVPILLYEAGEALRFDELAIRAGYSGVLNVMRELGMLTAPRNRPRPKRPPFIARSSKWVRAPDSGMLRTRVALGASVAVGDLLGFVDDPSSGSREEIRAEYAGVVIGRLEMPLVHEGDAIFHIARYKDEIAEVSEQVESFQANYAQIIEPGANP
ncbi:MAG: succinylglutamate desuccinylase/aspartoacylase family protein [Gammaproteobacteria bacterium SHHR-1]|uniref:succinylglutamate desuccinylase/aspartoacylase family protein n=1 Tax=Magnetovirga frankeli TaxID=947516 RepID=UPI001292FB6B|nr:succinylglutamate desuccinylase/aspartoacylase family protein [gamma proteobacterium SS-5]